MSINLPLVFFIAVVVAGLIWLFDALVLQKPRREKQKAIETQFAGRSLDDANTKALYDEAMGRIKEPTLVEYAKSFFPLLLIVFVLRSFFYEPFQIPSGSMIPTLKIGDFILVNKFTYGIRNPITNDTLIEMDSPKRGDVAVFFPPHQPQTYYIKRVIGLPGDRISYNDHVLTINGIEVNETLVARVPAVNAQYRLVKETLSGHEYQVHKNIIPGYLSRRNELVVPEGHYFMMGDNRDHSSDSRDWGVVSEKALVGRADVVWMHWDSFFSIPSFSDVGAIQ